MMNVSAVNCCNLQQTKSLGFGFRSDAAGRDNVVYEGPTIDAPPPRPEKPSFEQQVLANQQKMIGMLKDIKAAVAPEKVDPSLNCEY